MARIELTNRQVDFICGAYTLALKESDLSPDERLDLSDAIDFYSNWNDASIPAHFSIEITPESKPFILGLLSAYERYEAGLAYKMSIISLDYFERIRSLNQFIRLVEQS